jgi:hypothetical protein
MAAQTIAAQVAELVGLPAPNSLDDWAADAANKLLRLLPYQILEPFTTPETCDYNAGGASVAQRTDITFVGTADPATDAGWYRVYVNGYSNIASVDDGVTLAEAIDDLVYAINNNANINTVVLATDMTTYLKLTAKTAGVFFTCTADCSSAVGELYIDNTTITANALGTEIATKDKRIFEVLRTAGGTSRICKEITPMQYIAYADSSSLYYPTAYDPTWTSYSNKLKVLPYDATMVVTAKTLPLFTTVNTNGLTAITTLPEETEALVVLDLAERVAMTKVAELESVETAITDEDVELSQGQLQKIQVEKARYHELAARFRDMYNTQLAMKFGIDLRPRAQAQQ